MCGLRTGRLNDNKELQGKFWGDGNIVHLDCNCNYIGVVKV